MYSMVKIVSRFKMEISGELGDYWKKNAEKEVQNAVIDVSINASVDDNGAIKWIESGNYLPDDYCERLEYGGFNFSRKATAIERNKQSKEQIKKYIKIMKNKKYSEAELDEMRNAYGKGVTIINVLTGKTLKF